MGGWLTGLGAGAQGILGQRAANQEAGFKAQNFALDQATTRIQQQNALLEQQKFQQAQQAAQDKQAAIEAIRQKNIQMPVGNGQTMNLADMLAMGKSPQDFAPPADKLTYKTTMVGGKPHRFSRNESVPNSPWNDEGEAAPSPSLDKPNISTATEGLNNFREGIDPKTGAVLWKTPTGIKAPPAAIQERLINSEDAATLGQAIVPLAEAIDPNDSKKLAAQATLYSWSKNPYVFPTMKSIWGEPDKRYFDLFSQLGQMGASLSKAYMGGRPSQQLFKIFNTHMPNVGEPPQVIIEKVKDLIGPHGTLAIQKNTIDQMYGLAKQQAASGDMDEVGVGAAPESSAAPSGGSGEWSTPELRRGPDGKPRMTRHNGSAWQMQDPSGAWVPM